MSKITSISALALACLGITSCDNSGQTVSSLTAQLLDVQNKLGAMESMQTRMVALEAMAQRLSAVETIKDTAATRETTAELTRKVEDLDRRLAKIESLANLINVEGLPGRLSSVESDVSELKKTQAPAPIPTRVEELEKRMAELEKNQQPATPAPEALPEPSELQRCIALLKEYSVIGSDSDSITFLGHVARVEHNDASMTDFPILAELLAMGTPGNPIPASCVSTFIKAGADIKAPDSDGRTPLMLAAAQADPDVVDELLKQGADAGALDNDDMDALFYALAPGDGAKRARIVRALCSAGCKMDKYYPEGRTVLVHCLYRNIDPEVVVALVDNGADAAATNRDGTTLMNHLEGNFAGAPKISDRTRSRYIELWEDAKRKSEAQPDPAPGQPAE